MYVRVCVCVPVCAYVSTCVCMYERAGVHGCVRASVGVFECVGF